MSRSEKTGLKKSKPIIAVTMATSRQGSAVVKHLSKSGIFQIRAITRSPLSERAQKLAALQNVQIFQGDLLEPNSLERCFSGVYGIFGNTTPTKGWVLGRGSIVPDYEINQGRNLIDVVKKISSSGTLKHFIFSSVCKPKAPLKHDPAPGHFTSKWYLEDYLLINGLKHISTIIRPVSYFENFDSNLPGLKISETIFPGVVQEDKLWQTIAVDDIGLWTNAIFTHRKDFLGKEINLVGEEMTGREMADLLRKIKADRNSYVRYFMIPRILINFLEKDIGIMANWIETTGYGANLQELKVLSKDLGISMTSLTKWLKEKHGEKTPPQTTKVLNLIKRLASPA